MNEPNQPLNLPEVVKLVIPFATFLLGYLASSFDKLRDARRRHRNVRTILFKEMKENLRLLARATPAKGQAARPVPELLAALVDNLSIIVYTQYLGRLDELTARELDAIYEAYASVRYAKDQAAAFSTFSSELRAQNREPSERQRNILAARATVLIVGTESALDKLQLAIDSLRLSPNKKTLSDVTRGSALAAYDEALEVVDKKGA